MVNRNDTIFPYWRVVVHGGGTTQIAPVVCEQKYVALQADVVCLGSQSFAHFSLHWYLERTLRPQGTVGSPDGTA